MKKYFYRDFYGSSASITPAQNGKVRLRISNSYGQRWHSKIYDTKRGARIAMGKYSDGWREVSAA